MSGTFALARVNGLHPDWAMPSHSGAVQHGGACSKPPSTARRAGQWIAVSTLVVSIAGGVAIWLLDRDEFPTLGSGMWWSLQTVTTVGYGDHVPADAGSAAGSRRS